MVDVDDRDEEKYDVGLIPYSVKPQQGHSLWRNDSKIIPFILILSTDTKIRIIDLIFLASTLLDIAV